MLAVLHIKGINIKDLKLTEIETPPFMKILIDYLEGEVKHCKIFSGCKFNNVLENTMKDIL